MADERAEPPAQRAGASYAIYGDLDVDALLAAATPWAPHTVWRKGDPTPAGSEAKTAGVSVDVCDDRGAIEPAILRFLLEDRPFLTAATQLVSPAVRSVLTCRLQVDGMLPSLIRLSPTAVAQLAAARVELEIAAYPSA